MFISVICAITQKENTPLPSSDFDIMMGTVLPMFNVLSAARAVGLMEAAVRRTAEHGGRVR